MPSSFTRKYLNRKRAASSSTPVIMVAWMLMVFIGAAYTNPGLFWTSSTSSSPTKPELRRQTAIQVPTKDLPILPSSVSPKPESAGTSVDGRMMAVPGDDAPAADEEPRAFDPPPAVTGEAKQIGEP
uniref:Uncharacterized protein n=1 Tax=Lotharella oceanica TaxID=641309 RepID=A0A7S2TNM8_9EUKA